MKKFNFVSLILVLCALFCSCNNFFTSPQEECTASISGGISGIDSLNGQQNGRYAYADTAGGTIAVTAVCGDKTAEGAVSNSSYTIPLTNTAAGESWTVTATYSVNSSLILSGTVTATITEDNPYVNADIVLKPVSGNGDIKLKLTLDASENREIQLYGFGLSGFTMSKSGADYTISASSVPAGSYTYTFKIYATYNNPKEYILLYTTTQTINVYAGLETNKWCSGKSSTDTTLGPINSNGEFILTTDLIQFFARSTYYVDSTNGNDSNSGSYYSPVKTVAQAVSLANNNTLATETKNIYVKAGGSECLTSSSIVISADVNIEVYTSTAGDGTGSYTVTRDASLAATFSMIKITGAAVSISGLIIDGNDTEVSVNGAGINIESTGTLTLANTTIKNCKASGNGGGIYNSGTVSMSSGNIFGNSAANGGAIYNSGGTITFTGGTIGATADNTATLGSGIYQNGTLNMSGTACVNVNDDIYLPSGKVVTITGNLSSSSAAKITSESTTSGTQILSAANAQLITDNKSKFVMSSPDDYGIVQKTSDAAIAVLSRKIYVAGSGANVLTAAGNDSYAGTDLGVKIHPCATVYKAVSIAGDGDTIYVDGSTSESSHIEISSGKSINISKYDGAETATLIRQSALGSAETLITNYGTLNLTGISINGGGYQGPTGAGIYNTGTLTLSGATVTNCKAQNCGGGIYTAGPNATLTIKDGSSITGNFHNGSSGGGAGLYINGGTVTIEGDTTTISNNQTDKSGGGIYLNSGTLNFNGGTISGNTKGSSSSDKGCGIYMYGGTLNMSGSASASTDDDIYLIFGQKITIAGELTPPTGKTYSAYITVASAAEETSVLTQKDGTTYLTSYYNKFAIKNSGPWYTCNDGTISKAPDITKLTYAPTSSTYPNVVCSSGDGLTKLAEWVNDSNRLAGVTITQTIEIDLNNEVFTPIGTGYCSEYSSSNKPFKGTYDGGGYTIKNLKITVSGSSRFPALFECVIDATIKNLTVTGSSTMAGIVGSASNCTIENCRNQVNISCSGSKSCGGIVADFRSGGTIKNCINEGQIISTSSGYNGVGGIAGSTSYSGTILNCLNTGTISSRDSYTGGIMGKVYGTNSSNPFIIKNCVNLGTIEGGQEIVGTVSGTTTIENNYYYSSSNEPGTSGATKFTCKASAATLDVDCNVNGITYSSGSNVVTALNAWINAQGSPADYKEWRQMQIYNVTGRVYEYKPDLIL